MGYINVIRIGHINNVRLEDIIKMVIGIDQGKRSKPYVFAAKKLGVPYKLVNCHANDIIQQIKEVDALIWHWTQDSYIEKRIAFSIIQSAELMGKMVYPDSSSCWMFDDKIAEKYLLESIQIPLVESFVFFSKDNALAWVKEERLPVVYKLPQGAGSSNVRLIRDWKDAERVCKIHFSLFGRPDFAMQLYSKKLKFYLNEIIRMLKNDLFKYATQNKGFIYFQKYLPNNTYDIRVTIIGDRAIIFKRWVRPNDFRASGSGRIDYNVSEEDKKAILIARKVTDQIHSITMALDFIYDKEKGNLKIVELSYGFMAKVVEDAPGWYDRSMNFHLERTDVHEYVIKHLISQKG